MLDNIKIQNYRNLKSLRIEKLGRVNLIIGKNNTGKTSLLEAIYLFANQNDTDSIFKILVSRSEDNLLEKNSSNQHLNIINNLGSLIFFVETTDSKLQEMHSPHFDMQ